MLLYVFTAANCAHLLFVFMESQEYVSISQNCLVQTCDRILVRVSECFL